MGIQEVCNVNWTTENLIFECIDKLLPILTKIINEILEKACVSKSLNSSFIKYIIKNYDLVVNVLKIKQLCSCY